MGKLPWYIKTKYAGYNPETNDAIFNLKISKAWMLTKYIQCLLTDLKDQFFPPNVFFDD